MQLAEVVTAIERIYSDIDPYRVSHGDRVGTREPGENLRYGAISSASLVRMLSRLGDRRGRSFVDLGSGDGRAVLLTAALSEFSELIGVEILEALHLSALSALERYDREVRPKLPEPRRDQRIVFRRGDIRNEDLSQADVVYVHSTCFQPELMARIGERASFMRTGSVIVSVSKPVANAAIGRRDSELLEMDWGGTIVFYQWIGPA